MAGKFMKIKRVVIPFISLVILTSQLAGCATLTSTELLEELQKGEEIVIEYSAPKEIKDNSIIEIDNQQYITENDKENTEIGLVNYAEIKELEVLTPEQLQGYFQTAYEMGSILEGSLDERINSELEMLVELVSRQEKGKLPEDYEQQYRAWRPVETETETETVQEQQVEEIETAPQEIQLFTDCTEQVWVTGAVNIRSGPGTTFERLGGLKAGQSVTRTGIGINEAKGWSRVQLVDGSTAYVSSKYLSNTKPVTKQQPTQQPKNETKAPASTESKQSKSTTGSSQSLDSLLSGLVDEDGFSIGHTDKNKDWSEYTPVDAGVLTGEKIEEGWRGIQ